MRRFLHVLLVATIFVSLAVMRVAVVPGRLERSLAIPFHYGIPLLIICSGALAVAAVPLMTLFYLANRDDVDRWRQDLRTKGLLANVAWLTLAEAALILALGGLAIYAIAEQVPARVGFVMSREAFEKAASEFAASYLTISKRERLTEHLDLQYGLFEVEDVGIDGRGGLYFRVYATRGGMGPDVVTFGFAKKPNESGCPFGDTGYAIRHLVDDWYVFRATVDSK